MKQNMLHIGLDVDDTQYHGSALNQSTSEILGFKCRPNLKGLLGQYFPGSFFRICYEASYIGYTLQRDLVEKGYHCDVVAPTSILSPRGKQIKTEPRKHIQALLRRNGRYYKAETQNKAHWTLHHYCWLERTIETSSGSFKVNLKLLLRQLKGVNSILTEYRQQIETLAKTPRYE